MKKDIDKITSGRTSLVHDEPLIFERSVPGRSGHSLPETFGDPKSALQHIPKSFLRKQPPSLPEVDEPTVVRHFTRLSSWNHGVDSGMYPLGSCTMKYNPRINESLARLPGFSNLHPYLPIELCQGALQLMWELADYLAEISGFTQVTLQPAAGAHGELTGIKMIRAYHKAKGNPRRRVLVPDTAHGTNPASSKLSGYDVVEIKSGPDGILMPAAVAQVMDEDVAAIMITNPNTLGLFESAISEIADIVHSAGGLVYCDGANLNSIMGITRPGDMGIDVLQFNLHKTFSTPHGGGGPGSGPVGVSAELAPYLPTPVIEKKAERFSLLGPINTAATLDLNTELFDVFNLTSQKLIGKPKRGDSVAEHTARLIAEGKYVSRTSELIWRLRAVDRADLHVVDLDRHTIIAATMRLFPEGSLK